MKTFLTAAVMALALAASAQAQGNNTFRVPYDDNKNLPPTLDFVGARVSSGTRVATNTGDSSKLWNTGAGVFYGVEIATGSVSNYVVCFDTGSILSNTVSEPKAAHLMMPCFAQTTNSMFCPAGTTGTSNRGPGKYFSAGLYCFAAITGNAAQVYIPAWRKARE